MHRWHAGNLIKLTECDQLCVCNRSWTLLDTQPDKWTQVQHLLPSDCSKRLDLQTLLTGDTVAAQDMKEKLENLQRSDAKIRKAAGSMG